MAITTPLIKATNSLTPQVNIPVNQIASAVALEIGQVANSPAVHGIVFAMDLTYPQKFVVLQYATAALRDTDLAAFNTQLVTSL